ncbi:MAG: hypothetical protein WDN67_02780 [Candidatus Moraniibacteriota bacterium]
MVFKKLTKKTKGYIVIPILLIGLGCLYYFVLRTPQQKMGANYKVDANTARQVISELKTIYPSADDNKQITVTYIGDPTSLASIEDLKKAQPGDYLIKFDYRNHAVLWRSTTEKIITIIDTNLLLIS